MHKKESTYALRLKSYIQPFERILAFDEVTAVAGAIPRPIDGKAESESLEYTLASKVSADVLIQRLAYWESVGIPERTFSEQVLRETTVNVVRNGVSFPEIHNALPFKRDISVVGRRCLRYGSHGIHEYRGKFFPQLVRSLLNASDLRPNAVVADPMSGSGTTAVEATQSGWHFVGSDFNPLSVFMAGVKCSILRERPLTLERAYTSVRQQLLAGVSNSSDSRYFDSLAQPDKHYLESWFSRDALTDLDQIVAAINTVSNFEVRRFFQVALSNILRKVSWQKLSDLRVRKEIRPEGEVDAIRDFLEEIARSTRLVLAYMLQRKGPKPGVFELKSADAREFHVAFPDYRKKLDIIITSPPYATALPYLDTDRLSLIYLGLLPRKQHRPRDQGMIGNREITDSQRRALWERFQAERRLLPSTITVLIEKIAELNESHDVGFRRKNIAALLGKYFLDMRSVLMSMNRMLRSGAFAHLIVGDNFTTAGGKHVRIPTTDLMGDLGESVGFRLKGRIQMEMLQARDIHQENSIQSEAIIKFAAS